MAAAKKKEEANYEDSASLVDLKARQEEDYVPPGVVGRASDAQKSENGYVGVDPIYQNFVDETHQPGIPDEGAEAEIWQTFVSEDVDTSLMATPESVSDAQAKRDSGETYTADGATVKADPRPTVGETQEQWDEAHAGDNQTTAASGGAATPPKGGDTPPSSQK